jgi:protein-tyrosine-phosphatase
MQEAVHSTPVDRPSILFVCTGNTCRSVIAEYLAKRRFQHEVSVESAGLTPQQQEDASNAIETLREMFRIDALGHMPRDVRALNLDSYTLIIAMHKSVARELSTLTKREITVWKIDDPWGDDLLQYRRCARQIMEHVDHLSQSWRRDA